MNRVKAAEKYLSSLRTPIQIEDEIEHVSKAALTLVKKIIKTNNQNFQLFFTTTSMNILTIEYDSKSGEVKLKW